MSHRLSKMTRGDPPPRPRASSLIGVRLDVQHGVELLRRVAQQALQVTDETVDVAFPGRLVDDVLVVVVP